MCNNEIKKKEQVERKHLLIYNNLKISEAVQGDLDEYFRYRNSAHCNLRKY